jgi:hypothetical protein
MQPVNNYDGGNRVAHIRSVSPLLYEPIVPRMSRQIATGVDSSKSRATDDRSLLSTRPPLDGSTQSASMASSIPTKSRTKRAYTAATFYTECLLSGVTPADADTAAREAQRLYDKWWIESKYRWKEQRKEKTLASVVPPENEAAKPADSPSAKVQYRIKKAKYTDLSLLASASEASDKLPSVATASRTQPFVPDPSLVQVRTKLIAELQSNGGDTSTPQVLSMLETLQTAYKESGADARHHLNSMLDGTWTSIMKPSYPGAREEVGADGQKKILYTLGRLSFDMYRPSNTICSVQGVFHTTGPSDNKADGISSMGRSSHEQTSIPAHLVKDALSRMGNGELRKYE